MAVDSWTQTRSNLATRSRFLPPDHPELAELRALLKVQHEAYLAEERAKRRAAIADRLVDQGVTLTDRQLTRLESILKNASREQAAR